VVFLICGECEYRRTAVAICASSMFCVGLPCNACKQHVLCGFAVQCVQAACSVWVCRADCCNAVMCEQFVLFGLLCESKCVLPGLSCVLRGLSCENKRVLSGLPCVSSVFCVGHLVRASRPFRLRLV
jgi:hypothetical protein